MEESTSEGTLRQFLSFPYAAPEQWEMRHCSPATDIYALGCLAHALLTGKPPFVCTEEAQYRAAHVNQDPPPITSCSPRLRALVTSMLRKPQQVRPSVKHVRDVLAWLQQHPESETSSDGYSALRLAAANAAEEAAKREAAANREKEARAERIRLCTAGIRVLQDLLAVVESRLRNEADGLQVAIAPKEVSFTLGYGHLEIAIPTGGKPASECPLPMCGWDIIAVSSAMVTQLRESQQAIGASLYYAKRKGDTDYRWWEIKFCNPYRRSSVWPIPADSLNDADAALRGITGADSVLGQPLAIDVENIEDTCVRWGRWLAEAQAGTVNTRLD